MKKYKIILPVLALLAVASAALSVYTWRLGGSAGAGAADGDSDAFSLAQSRYSAILSGSSPVAERFMATDFEDIFYTADRQGNVRYYRYSSAGFAAYDGKVETLRFEAVCSTKTLKTLVYCIEREGKIFGVGVTRETPQEGKPAVFDYAFFKAVNLPARFGSSGLLLLADFDSAAFTRDEKVFTEAFIAPRAGGKAKPLTGDIGRTVDTSGALRSDWLMLTDFFIESPGSLPLFFSSRYYNLGMAGERTDILTAGGDLPKRTVIGILGLWAYASGEKVRYLKNTSSGFSLFELSSGKDSRLLDFTGNFAQDYLLSGRYLLDTRTFVLTDLVSLKKQNVKGVALAGPSYFSVSPSGKYAVITGGGDRKQEAAFCNLALQKAVCVAEPMIFTRENPNFRWVGDTLLHYRPLNDDGSGLSLCVVDMPLS